MTLCLQPLDKIFQTNMNYMDDAPGKDFTATSEIFLTGNIEAAKSRAPRFFPATERGIADAVHFLLEFDYCKGIFVDISASDIWNFFNSNTRRQNIISGEKQIEVWRVKDAFDTICVYLEIISGNIPETSDNGICEKCKSNETTSGDDVCLVCYLCEKYYHPYCVGLIDVPGGLWCCKECEKLYFSPSSANVFIQLCSLGFQIQKSWTIFPSIMLEFAVRPSGSSCFQCKWLAPLLTFYQLDKDKELRRISDADNNIHIIMDNRQISRMFFKIGLDGCNCPIASADVSKEIEPWLQKVAEHHDPCNASRNLAALYVAADSNSLTASLSCCLCGSEVRRP